jgi:hypothetical protein
MNPMSEPLRWTQTGDDRYEAGSGHRLYRVSKDSSGLPERVWNVVLLDVDSEGANEQLVVQAWAPMLEDAKQIAQGWDSEYGLSPMPSE